MPELDRRDFLKLVGVGAGATVAAGCAENVERLIPYVVQPEDVVPGIATWYASTCRECSAGCGLHVRTREGRPVKLEGNPEHPVNKGALCARGQSGILRPYHPDRFTGPLKRGDDGKLAPISWDDAVALLAARLKEGASGAYLLGADPGPTAASLLDRWVTALGAAGRIVYEPFAPESLREAASIAWGVDSEPLFDLSKADLVISLGADVLETGVSPTEHARQLAEARDIATHADGGARFVYVGPRLSMTASNADEWIPAKPGTEGILALALARAAADAGATGDRSAVAGLLQGFDAAAAASRTGVDAKTIARLGAALAKAKAPVVLPPGGGLSSRRATATAAAVLVLNQVVGAVGKTVTLPPLPAGPRASYKDLLALVDAMKSGKVSVLLVHGADPLYSMPAASGFAEGLAKVGFVVSFASMADATTEKADLVLPDHTPLESWGDSSPRPGVRSLVQPTLRPLYDTRAMVDSLLDVGRAMGEDVAAKLPQGTFRTLLEAAWSDTDWRQALRRGGVFGEAPAGAAPSFEAGLGRLEVTEPLLEGDGDFVLLAHPHPLLSDGRGANLPWLQELGDPVTKVCWTTWVEVERETAGRLGLALGDIVTIRTAAGEIEAPVLPRGGIRPDVIAVAVGQGHTVGWFASQAMEGRPGEARGANVISVLPAATDESGGRAWLCTRAKLTKTGRSRRLPFVQTSDNQRGRGFGQAVTLAALAEGGGHAALGAPAEVAAVAAVATGDDAKGAFRTVATDPHGSAPAGDGHGAEHGGDAHGGGHGGDHGHFLIPFDPADDAAPDALHRWAMAVDLDRCTGCSACVAACYVENNIPIVGEDQVLRGRHMSWLRIERWVGDGEVDFIAADVRYADREQLGVVDVRHAPMTCQQCGSAPCEPVCPVIATYHNPEGLNGMVYNRCIGTRYCANNCPYKVRRFNWFDNNLENWPAPMHLMLNPDVTVRVQGVMEKCTFCVQRVEAARQPARDQKRPIRDGEVVSACAQACPTGAITFGNAKDPESQVVKKGSDPKRGYHALHILNTRPAITYLAKVTRGPVEG